MGLKLMAEIGLDGSGVQRGLNTVRQSVSNIAATIGAAFSVGAVTALAKKTIEFAGHITDLSARLGVSTSYLQEMQYVMKQNGGSVDDLTTAFEKMGAARVAALQGDADAQANFAKFGISKENLKTMATQDIMDAIAGKFKEFGRNDVLVSAFKEMGGKAAGALIPSFVDGLEEGRKSARDAGAVIKAEYVAQLDELGDSFDRLSMVLVAQVAPAILAVMQAAKQLVAGTQGLGSFWGAATANITAKDVAKFGILSLFKMDTKAGTLAEINSIDSFLKGEQAAAAARAARIAGQNRPQEVPYVADKTTPSQAKLASVAKVAAFSDGLLSVGNFLGSGRATLETVAQKQLAIQTQMLSQLTKIANKGETTIKVP